MFKKSFTLIELLVAVSIIGLISTALVGIFIQALTMQKTSERLQALQTDARFLLERMSQVMRVGTINYEVDGYNGLASAGSEVYLVTQEGEKLHLQQSGDKILLNNESITPANLKVKYINFDPYPKNGADKEQRRVEMQIKMMDQNEQSSMILNLVVTSRVYDIAW